MDASNPVLLSARGLTKHYALKRGRPGSAQWTVGTLQVLNGVTFDVRRGETLAVLGGPGSGKSTLARLLVLLVPATSGEVYFDGQLLTHLRGNALRAFRRLHRGTARSQKIAELLEMVGLNQYHEGRLPLEFSGAQRQRIAIARALALSPELLIWDEPASQLEPAAAIGLRDLLARLRRHLRLTCLVLTRSPEEAQALGDRVVRLEDGRIVESVGAASTA
jgi:ABC-type glutathione transport system ATPase component